MLYPAELQTQICFLQFGSMRTAKLRAVESATVLRRDDAAGKTQTMETGVLSGAKRETQSHDCGRASARPIGVGDRARFFLCFLNKQKMKCTRSQLARHAE